MNDGVHVARWRAAWQENKAMRETLDACVTRRRIAFNMFKQQYWDFMEEGLQVSLHDLDSHLGRRWAIV